MSMKLCFSYGITTQKYFAVVMSLHQVYFEAHNNLISIFGMFSKRQIEHPYQVAPFYQFKQESILVGRTPTSCFRSQHRI